LEKQNDARGEAKDKEPAAAEDGRQESRSRFKAHVKIL
jgi:hypothetical protein